MDAFMALYFVKHRDFTFTFKSMAYIRYCISILLVWHMVSETAVTSVVNRLQEVALNVSLSLETG
jgi:hypothetical protein